MKECCKNCPWFIQGPYDYEKQCYYVHDDEGAPCQVDEPEETIND